MSEGSPALRTSTSGPASTSRESDDSRRLHKDCDALLDLLLQSASLKRGRASASLTESLCSLCDQAFCGPEARHSSAVGKWLAELARICSESATNETQSVYESLSESLPEKCVEELHRLQSALGDCVEPSVLRRLENAAHMATRLRALEHHQSAELENRKREALYHFAYGLSHELNNPLANISTRAGVLLQTAEQTGLPRDLLSAIVDNSLRGCEMLGDLMLVARPPKLTFAPTPIGELLAELAATAGKWAERWSIEVQWRNAIEGIPTFACDPTIECDSIALREALWALVRNAIEASSPGGTILLSCQRVEIEKADSLNRQVKRPAVGNPSSAAGWICIGIQDEGPGLSQIALKHAFDPYFSGREAGRGLGLGLTKALRIVELHGGAIELENNPTRGAHALAYLPLTDDNNW
jgi:signal transduction histidine kinase